LFLSPKPYPHKCAEAGARTRDLPVTDGRLYRCTRPALQLMWIDKKQQLFKGKDSTYLGFETFYLLDTLIFNEDVLSTTSHYT